MKHYILIGLSLLALASAGCSQAKSNDKNQSAQSHAAAPEKAKVTEMNAAMFKEKITDYTKHPNRWNYKGQRPVVIDFYATWCGPCKMTGPIVEELAGEYDGKIDFYKVDVDKNSDLASAFNIQSIPTFLFIPTSGEPRQSVGAMTKSQFEEIITTTLLNNPSK